MSAYIEINNAYHDDPALPAPMSATGQLLCNFGYWYDPRCNINGWSISRSAADASVHSLLLDAPQQLTTRPAHEQLLQPRQASNAAFSQHFTTQPGMVCYDENVTGTASIDATRRPTDHAPAAICPKAPITAPPRTPKASRRWKPRTACQRCHTRKVSDIHHFILSLAKLWPTRDAV